MKDLISHNDRITLAIRYYGLCCIGLDTFDQTDVRVCLDNMRVPFKMSQLTDDQEEYLVMYHLSRQ